MFLTVSIKRRLFGTEKTQRVGKTGIFVTGKRVAPLEGLTYGPRSPRRAGKTCEGSTSCTLDEGHPQRFHRFVVSSLWSAVLSTEDVEVDVDYPPSSLVGFSRESGTKVTRQESVPKRYT